MSQLIHATCLEVEEVGCLLVGNPGTGKSSLASELLVAGAKLVADDQVIINASHRMLNARAPESLHGVMELYGMGAISIANQTIKETALELVFQCYDNDKKLERMPEATHMEWLGISLPCYAVVPSHHATAAKIQLFCQAWREGRIIDSLSTELKQRAS